MKQEKRIDLHSPLGRDKFGSIECADNYQIKISGGGTKEDIAKALRLIADALYHETSMGHGMNLADEMIDGAEWEDCTLLTELNKTAQPTKGVLYNLLKN